jgi:hypothetical protein
LKLLIGSFPAVIAQRLFCGIEHELKIGDTIGVKAGEKKARCNVVWAMKTGSVQNIQVGVQLVSRLECPWRALLPKGEGDAPIVAAGCRRWERHKITILIALYDERSSVPIRIPATDVSGRGCYVKPFRPFPSEPLWAWNYGLDRKRS